MADRNNSCHRRKFLKTVTAGSLLIAGTGKLPRAATTSKSKTNTKVRKVIDAMLTMQRASWEQGVAMQALLELGETELAYLMAKEAILRQSRDGRLSVLYSDNGVTDPAASGEAITYFANKTKENSFETAHKKMLNYLLNKAPKTEDGILYHVRNAPEIWIDSMYMAPPYLCAAGEFDEAIKQIMGIRNALWNKKSKLYSHRWNEEKKTFINQKFWGVGNGWALAGITRVVEQLPSSMNKEKDQLIGFVVENIEGCLHYLRSDGLFHNIIDDNSTFIETNLGQMLAYTIYRGVKSGWLPRAYFEKAEKMRDAAISKIDEHGFVQGVCGAPHFNSPGRATEGQAFFLLMEAARNKLIS